ncbi:peptidase M50 [uncultured Desulfobacter sp.]|uniref:peptidase M50 n=1 Tax=uncultured Desulfobacter sp. TaxID=240139 RepID=UPI002AA83745|nr:peptidase M50 [uncultured Desulfobacter sp.]
MSYSLFSESWYRVSGLKPRLRSHAQIHHHVYRGRNWYILQDHSTGTFHRFSKEAYHIIGLMDGSNALGKIWETACENLGDDMPSQDEVISLLSQLYQVDVLQSDIPPDISDLYERHKRLKKKDMINRLKSPLSITLPLIDPEKFLEKTKALVGPVFSKTGLIFFTTILIVAIYLAGSHWNELTGNLADRILALENVVLLWLVYPVIKTIHEFSHAYTVKHWGGEVHEMGVMFLVFMPIPYVDASASSAFNERYKRVMVGAAGILAELFLASLAVIVWVNVEPGVVRALAFNVMIISGISTILFNGNPLLRFDAYYVLSDLIEIPNLGTRSTNYINYLLQKYLLNIENVQNPVSAKGEAGWFIVYGLASFVYRMLIMVRIAVFVAGKFFIIGIAFAVWGLFGMLVTPLVKIFKFLFTSPVMERKKGRAITVLTCAVTMIFIGLFIIPFPLSTITEGVLWAPEKSRLYAGTDGFITKIATISGTRVKENTPLIMCANSELESMKKELEYSLEEYQLRYDLAKTRDRTETKVIEEEIRRISSELKDVDENLQNLIIKSPTEGIFLLPDAENLPGLFVRRGEQTGFVVDFKRITVMTVVSQKDIDNIRNRTKNVEAVLAGKPDKVYAAYVEREVPAASRELPSLALSIEGGGTIALDPFAGDDLKSFEQLFHFEVKIERADFTTIGERVLLKFNHGTEPLYFRIYRSVRRTFLSKFSV